MNKYQMPVVAKKPRDIRLTLDDVKFLQNHIVNLLELNASNAQIKHTEFYCKDIKTYTTYLVNAIIREYKKLEFIHKCGDYEFTQFCKEQEKLSQRLAQLTTNDKQVIMHFCEIFENEPARFKSMQVACGLKPLSIEEHKQKLKELQENGE